MASPVRSRWPRPTQWPPPHPASPLRSSPNSCSSSIARPGIRLGMLETIREFSQDRSWDLGNGDQARRRHLAYYVHLAERFSPELRRTWSPYRIDPELDNLRPRTVRRCAAAPL